MYHCVDSEWDDETVGDRRSNLSPGENMVWQEIRRDSKGKLLHIRAPVEARRFTKNIRTLAGLKREALEPGHYLIVSAIPISFRYRSGGGNDTGAFIVLANECNYLITVNEVERVDKAAKVA